MSDATPQHQTIKERIHAHLKETGTYAALKSIVASALGPKGDDGENVHPQGADLSGLTAAQRASVLARIASERVGDTSRPAAPDHSGSSQRTLLHVRLLCGRAFTHVDSSEAGMLSVCLQFGSQRFRSQSVPFCAEPQLRDGVLFDLKPPEAAAAAAASADSPPLATLEELRGISRAYEPMHVLVLQQAAGRESVLSSCLVEWRQVLHHMQQTLSVELPGLGAQSALPVGALELKLELLPAPPLEGRLTEAEVMLALKRERDAQLDTERRFLAYAQSWWAEYGDLNPDHRSRPVKLFAMSDLGTQRPVVAFVQPLRAERLVESPRHAAHLVSLIRHHREATAGHATPEVWRSVHATLATRSANTEERALLLCCLLLGFELEAYVCLGTDARGVHAWVMTRSLEGGVTFWEGTSGAQYDFPGAHPYQSISCIFSHRALYANTQASTSLRTTSLDIHDPSCWRSMDPALLKMLTPLPCAPLRPSTLPSSSTLEATEEAALRKLVDAHRAEIGVGGPGVHWDDDLAFLLAPALASYESERITGHTFGNTHFADSIKRKVPHGYTFKGFPHHFVSHSAQTIFDAWLRNEMATTILQNRASHARLAVRMRVAQMSDDLVSVWVMLAIAYRPD